MPMAVLEERYGAGLADRRKAMFEQAGLPYAESIEKIPNSKRALMLDELARERGVLDVLHPRLFEAYWAHGLDIGDERVLVEQGSAVGLGREEITDAFGDQRFLEQINAGTRQAIELGAGGVPAWLIDRRLLVTGAQPHELFARALEQLGHDPLNGEPSAG
jgi:predicted DsbA family dithiol-disulfide isomerase